MRTYTNQNSGLVVVAGKIKAISNDRTVMTVETEEYVKDVNGGSRKTVEMNVSNPLGFPADDYKVGYSVTAVGYKHGKGTIQADRVLTGNDIYEGQDLTVITGFVKFARLNEEKNADGTPKMKQDGVSPRKPHFDITLSVKEGDDYVNHVIKIYDGNTEPGAKSQIDRAKAMFGRFDRESNRIKVSVVTQPGQRRSYTTVQNGREYNNLVCDHMGYKSIDVEYIDQKERDKGAQANDKQPAQQAAPAEQAQNGQNGFAAQDMEIGENEFT